MGNDAARRLVGLVVRAGMTTVATDAHLLTQYALHGSPELFAEIVRRHAGMVFGTCRRVLRHTQDAEDAFQATFLVLARKAQAVRPPEALGRWLYGVALRTARKLRSQRYRRDCRKIGAVGESAAEPQAPGDSELADWLPILDQELGRLPARDRLPIVLCDLQGRSRKEAAEELGLAEGTLSSRLARAREKLGQRLIRRGATPLALSAVVAGNAFAVPSVLPSTSFSLTACSPQVMKLTEGVLQAMFTTTVLKAATITTTLLLLGGVGLWVNASQDGPPVPADKKPTFAPKPTLEGELVSFQPDNPKPASADEAKIKKLRLELVDTLKKQIAALGPRYLAGKDPAPEWLESSNALMIAELGLAGGEKSKRIKAITDNLERIKEIEAITAKMVEAGQRPTHHLDQMKARRLEAEIILAEEKAK